MEEEVIAEGLTALDWAFAVGVLVAGIALGRLVRTVLAHRFSDDDGEPGAADVIGRSAGMILSLAGFIYALAILEVRLTPLLGAIGIGGIAIALAAQAVLANAFASTLIKLRHPFRRGDQIRTNDFDGRVVDVNFRTVVLISMDGERVLIPASKVLDDAIVNYTARPRRRTTLEVGVDYATDLRTACELLHDAALRAPGVLSQPNPEVLVAGFGESSIDLVVRFWHGPTIAEMWKVRSEVAIAAKEALDGAGIEIPFPQRVLSYRRDDEPAGVDGRAVAVDDDAPA